jgi:SprT-like protein
VATFYDPTTEAITIVLTWKAYEKHGWEQFSSTIRHELIHAWQYHEFGDADHGRMFARFPRYLAALRTLHCTQVVACVRGLRRSDCPVSTLKHGSQP